MEPLRTLSLFAGIGGFDLGLEATGGFKTVAFCEISPKCQHLLRHHWPEVPVYDDVCTLSAERLGSDGIGVDAICGGFPCQDISFAGKGAGLAGERSGLWREYARLIRELRPRVVVVENVSALLSRGLGDVLGDLAALGYDAEWDCIRASDVGAPHLRNRLWIVAYARGEQHEGFGDAFRRSLAAELSFTASHAGLCLGPDVEADTQHPDTHSLGSHRAEVHQLGGSELRHQQVGEPGSLGEDVADATVQSEREPTDQANPVAACRQARHELGNGGQPLGYHHGQGLSVAGNTRGKSEAGGRVEAWRTADRAGWWSTEPDVGRVAHGVPARVDRLHGLGNAVVPQIPETLGRAILSAMEAA